MFLSFDQFVADFLNCKPNISETSLLQHPYYKPCVQYRIKGIAFRFPNRVCYTLRTLSFAEGVVKVGLFCLEIMPLRDTYAPVCSANDFRVYFNSKG